MEYIIKKAVLLAALFSLPASILLAEVCPANQDPYEQYGGWKTTFDEPAIPESLKDKSRVYTVDLGENLGVICQYTKNNKTFWRERTSAIQRQTLSSSWAQCEGPQFTPGAIEKCCVNGAGTCSWSG